jgi:ribosomal protein S12 methylthiotransferase accessory factor YcaO
LSLSLACALHVTEKGIAMPHVIWVSYKQDFEVPCVRTPMPEEECYFLCEQHRFIQPIQDEE